MKINNEQQFDQVCNRINLLQLLKKTRGILSMREEEELTELQEGIKLAVGGASRPEFKPIRLPDDTLDESENVVKHAIEAVLQIVIGKGYKPSEQNMILHHVRKSIVDHWHMLAQTSEKERIEREENEKHISCLIQQQA